MFRKKDSPAVTSKTTAPVIGPQPSKPRLHPVTKAENVSPMPGSKGKQAYEARRAEKAGMGLEKWMAEKERRVQAERETLQRAHQKAVPRKPGLLRRLLDRAHRPI